MIYVSEKALRIIEEILEHLHKNTNTPGRILKTDVIHVALEEYAKKLGVNYPHLSEGASCFHDQTRSPHIQSAVSRQRKLSSSHV